MREALGDHLVELRSCRITSFLQKVNVTVFDSTARKNWSIRAEFPSGSEAAYLCIALKVFLKSNLISSWIVSDS